MYDFELFDYKELVPFETHYQDVIDMTRFFINNAQHGLPLIEQVAHLLGNENIKDHVRDSLYHYTFKQIFHDAVEFFNRDPKYKEDLNLFSVDYKEYFFDSYNINIDSFDFDEFVEKLHLMLKARKKSVPSTNFKRKLSEFAVTNNKDNCYLCGKKSINKLREEDFRLEHLYNLNKKNNLDEKTLKELLKILNDFEKKLDVLSILDDFNINKNDKIDIVKRIYSNLNFNEIRKTYKSIYEVLNSNVLELEHLHPVGWGGSKTKKNLLSSCHKCNQDKKDLTFYTDYSINRFFVNYQQDPNIVKKRLYGNLGPEALISLKMKQKYKCYYSDCKNTLSKNISFYIIKEEVSRGYHFFNLRIVCKDCLKSHSPEEQKSEEYIKETYILLK